MTKATRTMMMMIKKSASTIPSNASPTILQIQHLLLPLLKVRNKRLPSKGMSKNSHTTVMLLTWMKKMKSPKQWRPTKIPVGENLMMMRAAIILNKESQVGVKMERTDILQKDTNRHPDKKDLQFKRSIQILTLKSFMSGTTSFTSLSWMQRSLVLKGTNSNFNFSREMTSLRETQNNWLLSAHRRSSKKSWPD